MKERIATLLTRLPDGMLRTGAYISLLVGAAGVGWAGRGTVGEQVNLPGEVAAIEARVDSALTSIDGRIRTLVRENERTMRAVDQLSAEVGRLVCTLRQEERGQSALGC